MRRGLAYVLLGRPNAIGHGEMSENDSKKRWVGGRTFMCSSSGDKSIKYNWASWLAGMCVEPGRGGGSCSPIWFATFSHCPPEVICTS